MDASAEEKIDRLLEGLSSLNQKVEALQSQLPSQLASDKSNEKVNELSTKFLLEEYKTLSDAWKHVDSRLWNTLNLYLTISGAVIPAVAFITKDSKDVKLFLTTLALAALVLGIGGMFVTNRLAFTGVVKHEYAYALNLIRGFFVDYDLTIAPYLFLPFVSESAELPDREKNFFRKPVTNRFFIITHLWVGALFGFSISTTLWLIFSFIPLLLLVILGVLIAGFISYWLEANTQEIVKKRISRIWSRQQSLLSSLTKEKISSIETEDN